MFVKTEPRTSTETPKYCSRCGGALQRSTAPPYDPWTGLGIKATMRCRVKSHDLWDEQPDKSWVLSSKGSPGDA